MSTCTVCSPKMSYINVIKIQKTVSGKLDGDILNNDAAQAQKQHLPSVGHCGLLQVDIADWENTLWTEREAEM